MGPDCSLKHFVSPLPAAFYQLAACFEKVKRSEGEESRLRGMAGEMEWIDRVRRDEEDFMGWGKYWGSD